MLDFSFVECNKLTTAVLRRLTSHGARFLSSQHVIGNQNLRKQHSRKCHTGKEQDTETFTSESSEDMFSDYDSSEETETEYQTKQRILTASLPFVQQYGWTRKALIAGSENEGLPSVAHGMFPRGGVELVFHFYQTCNKDLVNQLQAELEALDESGQKVKSSTMIKNAIESRLRMLEPYKDTWPQAMAIQTLPQNAVESWTNLAELMDNIWYYAGDKSTDFNWYTKRASLAAVYKSAEIYMLQDGSEDHEKTWEFLDRRFSDLATFGKCSKSAQQMSDVMFEGLTGSLIMGRNMLGMNSWFR